MRPVWRCKCECERPVADLRCECEFERRLNFLSLVSIISLISSHLQATSHIFTLLRVKIRAPHAPLLPYLQTTSTRAPARRAAYTPRLSRISPTTFPRSGPRATRYRTIRRPRQYPRTTTTQRDASWRISRAEKKNRDARPDVEAELTLPLVYQRKCRERFSSSRSSRSCSIKAC